MDKYTAIQKVVDQADQTMREALKLMPVHERGPAALQYHLVLNRFASDLCSRCGMEPREEGLFVGMGCWLNGYDE